MSLGTNRLASSAKGAIVDTKTRQIENRLSKERITFLRTGEETGGESFEFEVRVPTDMIPPPPHLHAAEEELLEVLEGEMTVQTGGRQEVLRPGESHTVKRGTAHTWHNSGQGPLRFRSEFRPAGNMQSFFETYCGLAAEGRSDERGQPPLLQAAASLPFWGMYLAGPRSWPNACSWPCYGRPPVYADTADVTRGSSRVRNTSQSPLRNRSTRSCQPASSPRLLCRRGLWFVAASPASRGGRRVCARKRAS